jgi:YVTN family beta-propeller protein
VKLRRIAISVSVLVWACAVGGLTAVLVLPGVAAANPALWTIASSPNEGTSGSSLSAVSCVGTTFCMSAGSYVSSSSDSLDQNLIESWNGTIWSIVSSPDVGPGNNDLVSVSCVNSDFCVAVGSVSKSASSSVDQNLIESWNGATWSVVSSPNKGSGSNELTSVSCVSSVFCVAVGGYGSSSSTNTLVESWSGTEWSIIKSPNEGTDSILQGVSCINPRDCKAVGNGSDDYGLIESWNGKEWSTVRAPTLPEFDHLLSVSCVSSKDCQAVGWVYYEERPFAFALEWNGSAWHSHPIANNSGAQLFGVMCVNADDCQAVGIFAATAAPHTLVESWNGHSWTQSPSANVGPQGEGFNGDNYDRLDAVACGSSDNCFAVGSSLESPGSTLVEWSSSGDVAYVTSQSGGDTVTPFDIATGVAGPAISVGTTPKGIAITPDGTTAYVANYASGTVTPIYVDAGLTGPAIDVGNEPDQIAITPDGATAYVTNFGSDDVTPINTVTGVAGSTIAVGSDPDGIAITPSGSVAYVANSGTDTVTPITLATGTAVTPITVGKNPNSLAITPNGATLYVANYGSGTVSAIDTSDNSVVGTIRVGKQPSAIAITPNGSTAYVGNFGGDSVTPITTSDNSAGSPISFGGTGDADPSAIVVTPDGSTALVVNEATKTVVPIDTATNSTGTPLPIAGQSGIAISPDQPPQAFLSVTPAPVGSATAFSAAQSVASTSAISSYLWNFGDGESVTTTTPTTSHTYERSGKFTATVTETDAAGTSTTQVFTGQTMSRNGGPDAVASQTFVVVKCSAGTVCSGTVSATSQTSSVKGTSSTGASLSISIGQQPVSCGDTATQEQVTNFSTTTFNASSLSATLTVNDDSSTSGFEVCYSASSKFEDLEGQEVLSGELPLCKSAKAPCIKSDKVSSGTVVAVISVLPGDPRFWAPPVLQGFSPSSGAPGSTVTITGGPFKETKKVEFDGIPTEFRVNSKGTAITTSVPVGAQSGPITVITPQGEVISSTFNVT